MVIVKLKGGLGNQIFQYAAGRSVAVRNNMQLKLDSRAYINGHEKRGYELGKFTIKESFPESRHLHQLMRLESTALVGKPLRLVQTLVPYRLRYLIKETSFRYDRRLMQPHCGSLYLDGYWQSEKYFECIEDILRDELTPKEPLKAESLEFADQMVGVNAVSIHVRRGDYATAQSHGVYVLLGLDYYEAAVSRIVSTVNDPVFFVFSDDLGWAKENLKLRYPCVYVEQASKDVSFDDLILMSMCKHHVIANSTFSWWGAWLNRYQEKIVVAPRKWFNDANIDTADLIPSGWVTV